MALVVFLRGVNVGGHRTFRPSVLAKQLRKYDVVNIGAAGTFVVREPISQKQLRTELQKRLPFKTEIMICEGRDLVRLEKANPFGEKALTSDIVRFVAVLSKANRPKNLDPFTLPSSGRWLLKVMGSKGNFVFGLYRRHMKVIGYLGQMDKIFGTPATIRNWNTIVAVLQVLKEC